MAIFYAMAQIICNLPNSQALLEELERFASSHSLKLPVVPKNWEDLARDKGWQLPERFSEVEDWALRQGLEMPPRLVRTVDLGSPLEKAISRFLSYELRFYHPSEKKYVNKRFGRGASGRQVVMAEKTKIEAMIDAKLVGTMPKDYPLEKMLSDYEMKPPESHSAKYVQRHKQIIGHFRRFFMSLKPKITRVMQLNRGTLDKYIEMRLGETVGHDKAPPSKKTIRNEISMFMGLVNRLADRDIIERKPIDSYSFKERLSMKGYDGTPKVLTEEELAQVIERARKSRRHEWFANVLEFEKYTGAREGEILNLEWRDIDFEAGEIKFREKRIEYTNSKNQKKVYDFRPKSTGDDVREEEMPIHPSLLPLLKRLKEKADQYRDDFVFHNSVGARISEGMLRKVMMHLAAKIGRPDVTSFHQLRHLFADKVFASSMGDPHASRLALRHKHLSTSADYIAHQNKRKKRDLIERIQYPGDGGNAKESKPLIPERATIVTYLVGGRILPCKSDDCPACGGKWGGKYGTTRCPNCGIFMRKDVKVVSQDLHCIFCVEGRVDQSTRICDRCNDYHDEALVVLGKEELTKAMV